MPEIIRAIAITALVVGTANATMAGYDLVMVSLDSLVAQTYNPQNFQGDDEFSSSMRGTVREIGGNYKATKRSLNATADNTDNGTP
jgi:hypothetical protein